MYKKQNYSYWLFITKNKLFPKKFTLISCPLTSYIFIYLSFYTNIASVFIYLYIYIYIYIYVFIYLYVYNKLKNGCKDLVENCQIGYVTSLCPIRPNPIIQV